MLNLKSAARSGHRRLRLTRSGSVQRGSVMNASILSGLAAAGVIAGAMALSSPSRAATVDLIYHLDLDGMSTGTCAGMKCPTSFGNVTVTGDTTGSLDFSVALSPDVNFSAGHSFWFDLSAGTNPITFALEAPTSGTIGLEAWNWVTPFSTGSFTPAPGTDFPGPYADLVQCTTTGNICGTELNFTASGADATHPFVIGAPRGAGNFAEYPSPLRREPVDRAEHGPLPRRHRLHRSGRNSRTLDLGDDASRLRGAWFPRLSQGMQRDAGGLSSFPKALAFVEGRAGAALFFVSFWRARSKSNPTTVI